MSAQTIAFHGDVGSACVEENLVLVGQEDSSVPCISTTVVYHQTLKIENYHL